MEGCLHSQAYISFSCGGRRHLSPDMLSEKLFIFILHLSLKVVTTFSGYLFCTSFLPLRVLSACLVFICQRHISLYFKHNFWKVTSSFCSKSQPSHGKKFQSARPPFCSLFWTKIGTSDIFLDEQSLVLCFSLSRRVRLKLISPRISTEPSSGQMHSLNTNGGEERDNLICNLHIINISMNLAQ